MEVPWSSRCPLADAALQPAIANRFGEVVGVDRVAAIKIGDGPGHAQDPVQGARRKLQGINGAFQQQAVARLQAASGIGLPLVQPCIGSTVAGMLARAGGGDTLADVDAGLSRCSIRTQQAG